MSEREVDYLMGLSESGVMTYSSVDADINNVVEWLDTPEGSIYGMPEWGNPLAKFKHEPTHSEITAMNIEFAIIEKLPRDLPNIVIESIFCEPSPTHPDLYHVRLGLPSGELEKTLN